MESIICSISKYEGLIDVLLVVSFLQLNEINMNAIPTVYFMKKKKLLRTNQCVPFRDVLRLNVGC